MTTTQARKTRTRTRETRDLSEMQRLARRVEQHHTAGLPDAQMPDRHPFPAAIITTLWLGIVGGGVFGLLFGVLLQNNILVLPSIEGLYSMTPFTFEFFWLVAGVALGIVGAAVATLLIPPPDYHAQHPQPPQHGDGDTDTMATGNILEIDLDEDGA